MKRTIYFPSNPPAADSEFRLFPVGLHLMETDKQMQAIDFAYPEGISGTF